MREKISYLIIVVFILLSVSLVSTYAYFSANAVNKDVKETTVGTGELKLRIDDKALVSNDISPIYDVDYEMLAFHKDFEVISEGSLNGCASIYLKVNKMSSSLNSKFLKYVITSEGYKSEGTFENTTEGSDMLLLDKVFVEAGSVKYFDLYMWISYDEETNQIDMLGTSIDSSLMIKAVDAKNEGLCK